MSIMPNSCYGIKAETLPSLSYEVDWGDVVELRALDYTNKLVHMELHTPSEIQKDASYKPPHMLIYPTLKDWERSGGVSLLAYEFLLGSFDWWYRVLSVEYFWFRLVHAQY